jgi:hypothetical protein
MAQVKLLANIIAGGRVIKAGTMMDLNEVPPRLRKRRWIVREGEEEPSRPSKRSTLTEYNALDDS